MSSYILESSDSQFRYTKKGWKADNTIAYQFPLIYLDEASARSAVMQMDISEVDFNDPVVTEVPDFALHQQRFHEYFINYFPQLGI